MIITTNLNLHYTTSNPLNELSILPCKKDPADIWDPTQFPLKDPADSKAASKAAPKRLGPVGLEEPGGVGPSGLFGRATEHQPLSWNLL